MFILRLVALKEIRASWVHSNPPPGLNQGCTFFDIRYPVKQMKRTSNQQTFFRTFSQGIKQELNSDQKCWQGLLKTKNFGIRPNQYPEQPQSKRTLFAQGPFFGVFPKYVDTLDSSSRPPSRSLNTSAFMKTVEVQMHLAIQFRLYLKTMGMI